jgi:hypothetical protein
MKFLRKIFGFKKVAIIDIRCVLPHNGSIMEFNLEVNLYENKYGDRKSSYKPDDYPVSSTFKSKELVEKFLNGQCTAEIPSYSKIVSGDKPIRIEDATHSNIVI